MAHDKNRPNEQHTICSGIDPVGNHDVFDMESFLKKHSNQSCIPSPAVKKSEKICSDAEEITDIYDRVKYLSSTCIRLLKTLSETFEAGFGSERSEFVKKQFMYTYDVYIEVSSYLVSTVMEDSTGCMECPDDFPDTVTDSVLIYDLPDRFRCTAVLLNYMRSKLHLRNFSCLSYCAGVLFAMDLKTMAVLHDFCYLPLGAEDP